MSIVPATTTEYIWFGTRAVKFESGGSTGPQLELLADSSDFATRTLSSGTHDYTGSEWQQFLAFSGTAAEMAALGINLADGVDTATAGSVNTTGDLRVGSGVEAHNIADSAGGGRLIDTTGTLDDSNDPLAITGSGKASAGSLDSASIEAADTGNRVVFSNDIGFGFINCSGFDSGGSANALRLNDGDAINFAIKHGRVLSEASFTVKVLGSGSTNVVVDSDGKTVADTNGALSGGFVQDASSGELNLGVLAHGTKVTINYVSQTIWFNGAVMFMGDTSGFFTAFGDAGANDLTLGSVVGNQIGWSADNLALATENAPPVFAGATGGSGDEDTVILGDANATDPNGDTLAYTVEAGDGPANGSIVMNAADGTYSYTPDLDFNGSDSFTVTISDGQGGVIAQLISLTVNAVNDDPLAGGYTGGTGNEDSPILGDVDGSDVDGDTLTYTVEAGDGPADGGVVVNAADGSFTYTPDADFNGADSFTVTISDGNGGTTTQLVNIVVNAVNDAAVFGGDSTGNVAEDGTLLESGSLIVSDVDAGEAVFASTGALAGIYGDFTFTLATGAWTYTLRNGDANVQALITGQTVQDTLLVTSADGGTTSIVIDIAGLNEPIAVATLPSAFTGTGDPTDTLGGGATAAVVFTPPGGGSSNLVTGTTGANLISAGNNADTVYGYGGADTINGDAGNDSLFGQTGDDVVNGNDGADTLFGGSGADSMSGGNGGDLLIGGYGADSVSGGADADTFRYLTASDTNDVLTGYAQAADIIDFAALNAGTLTFNAAASQSFAGANSVSWYNDAGNTIIIAELDGNVANAELMLTISGQTLTMAAANFIL